MPKLSAPLSIVKIKNLKPKDKEYFVGDGENLFIKVSPSGLKTFIYVYKDIKSGKRKQLTLGKFGVLDLKDARIKRDEIAANIAAGYAPKQKIHTLKSVFDEWIKSKKTSFKHSFWIKRRFETLIEPNFAQCDIKLITRKDILSAIKPLIIDEKLTTANKFLTTLNNFYKFALLYEYAPHNIIADIDKRALLGKIDVKHYAYLKNDDEIVNLIKGVKNYFGDERIKICALFQLYTATRGANARNALWSEIDFDRCLWRIPPEKMKMAQSFEVFLTKSVKNMLLEYRAKTKINGDFIFPSLKTNLRPISENSVRIMLRNLGFNNDDITPHGFRATFSTICHERRDEHGFSSDVIELCLAHTEQNKVKDAYNHAKNLKARAGLMQWWSDYLDSLAV